MPGIVFALAVILLLWVFQLRSLLMFTLKYFAVSTIMHKLFRLNEFSRPGNMGNLTFSRKGLHVLGSFPTLERI